MSATGPDEPTRPVLRIVRGDPDDTEVAALVAALAARAGAPRPAPQVPASAWRDLAALVRRPTHPGPGAWRAGSWRY